jgi:hypothetical protein
MEIDRPASRARRPVLKKPYIFGPDTGVDQPIAAFQRDKSEESDAGADLINHATVFFRAYCGASIHGEHFLPSVNTG